jgi:DMSO/TMAO reductase YedYZ molybdopterin-dependent catalytic subunit
MNFSVNDGPLRFAILSPQGLLTDGHYWIKMVTKLEVLPAVKEWTLVLRGALTENMTRGTFESGVNCPTAHHGINWTDSNNNVWAGMPLWLLLGRVDDSDMHTTTSSVSPFNDTLALEGYTVKVTTGQGYSVEFNSTEVMHNPNFVVAYKLNGAPLPDPYWPLKLVGFAVPSEKRMSNITEIQIIFGS